MEDLEKYIFDPENPDKFWAYKLLRKVFKDNYVLLDDEFFIELFGNKIFDEEVEAEIWNPNVNFKSLSVKEKIKAYVNDYSQKDFEQHIIDKAKMITEDNNLFKEFLSVERYSYKNYDLRKNNFITQKHFDSIFNYPEELHRHKPYSSFNKNMFLLISQKNKGLLDFFEFKKASILLTTIQDYELIYDYTIKEEEKKWPSNLKPILLKKKSDIHALLNLVSRDVQKGIVRQKPTQKHQIQIPTLSKLHLQNYFFLKNIEIPNLTDQKEIYFVGENGDGKTILLQAIALALRGNQNIGEVINVVKSNFNKKEASEKLSLIAIDSKNKKYQFNENANQQNNNYPYVYAYGVNRFRHHAKDKDREGYLTLFDDDVYLENPVEWLQYLHYKEAVGEKSDVGLADAIDLLKKLLDDIEDIEVSPDKVLFISKGTQNQFEQLSHGYKSVIVWVGDLLTRLAKQQPYDTLETFKGVVLVDEIGLFLHPQWQYSIVSKLRKHFKKLQLIFTTHSPIVLLGASKDAIFYKVYKEEGETKISERLEDISSLMANSLLTSPLVGLDSAATRSFDDSKPENVSNNDYIYQQIHKVLEDKIKANPTVLKEETILTWVEEELAKLKNAK